MRKTFRRLGSTALCLAVLGLASAVGSQAVIAAGSPSNDAKKEDKRPPRAVKNVDEAGRAPYQVSTLFLPSACTFNSVLYFCRLDLPAVPAGKRLIVEHLSMFVAVNNGSPDSVRFLNSLGGDAFWVQPTFTPRVGNANHSFLDRSVLVYYEPGDTPQVLLALTAPLSSAEITVHGYLIDATN